MEREIKKIYSKSDYTSFRGGWRVVEREKHVKGEIEGVFFKGVIDRIDQDNTHTLILDYKSGSIKDANRVQDLEKLTDFQMSIYYELLKNQYKNMQLAFVGLFNGEITPITELEKKKNIIETYFISKS